MGWRRCARSRGPRIPLAASGSLRHGDGQTHRAAQIERGPGRGIRAAWQANCRGRHRRGGPGREKKAYASAQNGQQADQPRAVSDIYSFRVIAKSIDDCYRVLGVAHSTWRTVPGVSRYISTRSRTIISRSTPHRWPSPPAGRAADPHARGCRHRRVRRRRPSDLQGPLHLNGHAALAKTPIEFNKDSGLCVAAHTGRDVVGGSNPEEFLEHTKLELSRIRSSASRPKGRLIALPRGARRSISLCSATRTSATGRRGFCQRAVTCDRHAIAQRRRSRDRDGEKPYPAGGLGEPRRHRRARSAIRRAARDAVRKQYSSLGRRLSPRILSASVRS